MPATNERSRETPDLDLARRVSLFLAERQWPALRALHVEAKDGTVTLRGTVKTFYEKQLSQQCSRRVAGVRTFVDRVNVAEERPRIGAQSA